jgi:hypothetical protein
MQLIQLEHGHWNFFCPVTGKEVYKEEGGITLRPSAAAGTKRYPMSHLSWRRNSKSPGRPISPRLKKTMPI